MASGSGGLAGGFAEVRNRSILAEQDDERARQEALRQLAIEQKHRQEDIATRDPATSQGALDTFEHYDEKDSRKYDARALELAKPSESASQRMLDDLGPARSMAFETGEEKTFELKNDPRGRAARLQAMLDQIGGGKANDSGPDAPIYYSGPPRHEGDPNDTMPYEGKVEALRGMPINRAAIQKEFGGTAPDETLSFTNRPKMRTPDMRRYDTERGTQKDVGAPGGTLGSIGGSGSKRSEQGQLVRDAIASEIEQAKLAPPTGREQAGEFVTSSPELNKAAQELDPNQLDNHIMQLVSDGKLSPQVGRTQSARYRSLADQATNNNGVFDRDKFNMLVRREDAGSSPAALSMTAREGGGKVEGAEAQKDALLKAAVVSPPGAPGTTPSPVETQGQPQPVAAPQGDPGFMQGFSDAMQQGSADRFGAPMPATPPGYSKKLARVVGPVAGGTAGAAIGMPNAGAGVGGFLGELAGQAAEGEDLNFGEAGVAGLANAAGSKVLGAVTGRLVGAGKGYLAGMRGAKAIGEGAEGSFGPAAFEPRTTTFQGETMAGPPLREAVGVGPKPDLRPGTIPDTIFGDGQSALARARQFSAEEASVPIPGPNTPHNPGRLPTPWRPGPKPPLEGEVMPPGAAAGDVLEGEVMDPADELLQLMSRGGGEGAKQLVPQIRSMSPQAKEGLLEELRSALGNRRAQGIPVTARDATELLAMMMRAGG